VRGSVSMRLFGVRQTLLGAALVAASCMSCGHGETSPAASRQTNPSPEEAFDTIVETFRRRIEDTPVGFVVSDSTGRTSMVGTNKVSSELIRPTNETDAYKAVITVTSESRYSILRTKKEEDSEEESREQNGDAKSGNPITPNGDDKGLESLDSELVSKPAPPEGPTGRLTQDVIKPPTLDKDVRNYELVYKNGRWTLVTELNIKTEQSIQNAFRNALDTQI
jgi:hypothetical protein